MGVRRQGQTQTKHLEVVSMAAATLARWDPFQQLAEMQHDFDRILGRPLHNGERVHPWAPPVDVERSGCAEH